MDKNKLILEPKLPKGEDGHSTFSIRVKTKLLNDIEDIASKTGHSRNELIGILLEYAVNNSEIQNNDK